MVPTGLSHQRVIARAGLLLTLVFALVTGARAQPAGVTGTMPEHALPELNAILRDALQQAPQVLLAAIEVERGEAARIAANSARWPSVSGNLNYATNQEAVSSNTDTKSRASGLFYSLQLSQTLFQWGAVKNQSAIGRIGLMIAEKNYAEGYRALSVLLRQSYLELVVKKARLRHARFTYERGRADLALARDNAAQFSSAVLAGRELDLREARLDLDRNEVEFATALRRFGRIAGQPEIKEERIADDLPRPAYMPELAGSIAASVLRDRAAGAYEPQLYALRLREAELRYKIESVRLLPKFYAGAGYSLDNSSTVGTNRVEQQAIQRENINVSAQWNIFDGFASKAAKMSARADQRLYTTRLAAAVDAVLDQVQALERTLKLDAEHLAISDERHAISVAGKRRLAEESALGQVARAEIERADANILVSQANAFAVRAKFYADWSEFISIAGLDPVLQNLPSRYVREKR